MESSAGLKMSKTLNIFILFFPVQPSQGNDPFDKFDKSTFDELDKEEKIHNTVDEGFARWEDGYVLY